MWIAKCWWHFWGIYFIGVPPLLSFSRGKPNMIISSLLWLQHSSYNADANNYPVMPVVDVLTGKWSLAFQTLNRSLSYLISFPSRFQYIWTSGPCIVPYQVLRWHGITFSNLLPAFQCTPVVYMCRSLFLHRLYPLKMNNRHGDGVC